MNWFFAGCILITSLLTGAVQATHYKLFVLTGQSNSLGTTNGGENDPSSGSDPADQHILFSWHNVVGATDSIGYSGETLDTPTETAAFTFLQDQQGGVYSGSGSHWGGEMEFARRLYRAGVRDFGVIKVSRGGGGNRFWSKEAGGHMYSEIVSSVGEAVASLPEGDTFEIVGLLYLQGESDGAGEAAVAGGRIKELTDNLRVDLPNASGLHTIIAGITVGGGRRDTVKNQHAGIAASTSYIDYFDNTDLQSELAPDNLHLNKTGKLTVGRRWAQAAFEAGIVSRHYGKLVFIGDSITQGGNGDHPSYRYQVFKNLANAGVPRDATSGYEFVGSVEGPYRNSSLTTPDVNGQSFINRHDGHWGWRASWESAREALPAGRYNVNNLGQGTLLNWTGQAATFRTTDSPTTKAYTAPTYLPDTVVIKVGINDLSKGVAASQVRDDLSTMIDQVRAAKPDVRVHISQVLYSNRVDFAKVDQLNALLPQLVASKNTVSTASPVWLVETNVGFDPTEMTYDDTHPNTAGEVFVGNRISSALGIIADTTVDAGIAEIAEKPSNRLGCYRFEGSDIYNSGSFASGWSSIGVLNVSPVGEDDLRVIHPNTEGRTLNGTNSGWSTINHSIWTFEARIRFNDIANGFVFWLGTGTRRILIEAYPDRTEDYGGQSFRVEHNNMDGNYHTFRVSHDPARGVYHVWRDEVRLTPPDGAVYDQTGADERLLMGDYSSGEFGDGFDVTVDYVEYCQRFEGNQIYSGTDYINDWFSVVTRGTLGSSLVDGDDLRVINSSNGGTWIEGTDTGWSSNNDEAWTFEFRAKINASPNGFSLWLGTGSHVARVEIYGDRTRNLGGSSFDVAHNNSDGFFHVFRIAHDPAAEVYHVFRDGERLTPIGGSPYDQSADDSRLILGDVSGNSTGDAFDVTIDRIHVDYAGVWIPVGTDTDHDQMSDAWENKHFNDPLSGDPAQDNDGDGRLNHEEYKADTDPNEASSYFRIESINWREAGGFGIRVPKTSSRREYTLYESVDLGLSDPWTAVGGQGPFSGTDDALTFEAMPDGPTNFYRVEVRVP